MRWVQKSEPGISAFTSSTVVSRWTAALAALRFRRSTIHQVRSVLRYDTIRDAILTCAGKPTWVSFIYRSEWKCADIMGSSGTVLWFPDGLAISNAKTQVTFTFVIFIIDVKRFYVFFYFPNVFLFLRNVSKVRSGKQINKKHFENFTASLKRRQFLQN